jgi:hypothetical protein
MAGKKFHLNPYHIHVLGELTEFDIQHVNFSVAFVFTDSNGTPTDIPSRVIFTVENCF